MDPTEHSSLGMVDNGREDGDRVLSLPLEIIIAIFSDFTAIELCHLSLVNKLWSYTIGVAPVLWETLIKKNKDTNSAMQLQDIGSLPSPILINFKNVFHYLLQNRVNIDHTYSTIIISVLTATRDGEYVVIAGSLNNTIFNILQIWKFPLDNPVAYAFHLGTILPGNSTCVKITAVEIICHKDIYFQEVMGDVLELFVGGVDGSVDVFRVYVLPDEAELYKFKPEINHVLTVKGNTGPISWTCTRGPILVTKSSLSLRVHESIATRSFLKCSDFSRYSTRNPESFKKKEVESTTTFNEMLKLSLKLSQHMWCVKDMLMQQRPEMKYLKKLSPNGRKNEKQVIPAFWDYDIFFWNLENGQCIRHFRREPEIPSESIEQKDALKRLSKPNKLRLKDL